MDFSWDEMPIHVIDFEGGPQCGIVEYGVVSLVGSRIQRVETRLCRPKRAIPRHEEALHGISTSAANREAPFQNEWDLFASMRQGGPLAAHFASAENRMLKSVFPYPRLSRDWAHPDRMIADWGPWLDTGAMYRDLGDDVKSLKLEDLILRHELQDELDVLAATHCPEGRRRYHCALYDAFASALLMLNYCHEYCDERPTVRQLLLCSQCNGERKQEMEQQRLL